MITIISMNQRGLTSLYIFLGIIILLALVGGAYYLGKNSQNNVQPKISKEQTPANPTIVPTLDPTASWKVYSNKKYGYLVKYPNNLQANEVETTYDQYVEFTLGKDSSGNAYLPNYTITVAKEDFLANDAASVNFLSIDWTKTFYTMNVGDTKIAGTVTFKKLPSEKLANQDAVVLNVTAMGIDQKRYLVKNKGYVYMIHDYNKAADYNLFLSTFEFTN